MAEPAGLQLDIPGFGALRLRHLVLDFNGTLAVDGHLLPGVEERLAILCGRLALEVVTADTRGTACAALVPLDIPVRIVASGADKLGRLRELGPERVVAIGNGCNDVAMFEAAALAMVVLGREGVAAAALAAADLVLPDILAALDTLIVPARLVASLRA